MKRKTPVAILGATGMVGQQLLSLLRNHPWFVVAEVVASARKTKRKYGEVVEWLLDVPLGAEHEELVLKDPTDLLESPLVFSCVSANVAYEIERKFVENGHLVVSNASAFRREADVPLVVPEVNPMSLGLLAVQRELGTSGGLITNPNCVVAGLVLGLAPLHHEFGLKRLVVSTLQAVSGAGYPGPASLQLVDNLIPWIKGEEEKIAFETARILEVDGEISVSVHRVPVLHGHTMSVFAETKRPIEPDEAIEVWRRFSPPAVVSSLPSAPEHPILYLDDQARPQPRLDRQRGGGMTVTIGRARKCPVLGLAFELCSHNLIRGAAGAALLNAELCKAEGWLS